MVDTPDETRAALLTGWLCCRAVPGKEQTAALAPAYPDAAAEDQAELQGTRAVPLWPRTETCRAGVLQAVSNTPGIRAAQENVAQNFGTLGHASSNGIASHLKIYLFLSL